jgi:chemotaxis protein MotB
MSVGSNAPVIIKRKKVVGGDGHHGGAWKVAIFRGPSMRRFAPGWFVNPCPLAWVETSF